MNIKDLMIGDLFRVNRDGLCIKKDTIVQIRGIDADNKFEEKGLVGCANCRPMDKQQYDGGIWLDYLSPIPLSRDFLLKNGFAYGRENELMDEYVFAENLEQSPQTVFKYTFYKRPIIGCDSLLQCLTKCKDGDGQNDVHICNLRYVHELQHATRLCGIDKDFLP